MKINVFADTICGWCFIGHRNLNTALKKFPRVKFDIKHIPFQLNQDMLNLSIMVIGTQKKDLNFKKL